MYDAIRLSEDRGHVDVGWLKSRHTFSFGDYCDPRFMGFGALRVINEDRAAPGKGFGRHAHQDMEILSWVLSGELEHKDSMGSGAVIRPGELQRMSAGTGVTHSEFNTSGTKPVHFLQIWLIPERQGLAPSYEQRAFAPTDLQDRLCLIASHDGRHGSVVVHQDVQLHAARLAEGREVSFVPAADRRVWLQVTRGALRVGGHDFHAGDAAAWIRPENITIRALESSEVLLFDLAI